MYHSFAMVILIIIIIQVKSVKFVRGTLNHSFIKIVFIKLLATQNHLNLVQRVHKDEENLNTALEQALVYKTEQRKVYAVCRSERDGKTVCLKYA